MLDGEQAALVAAAALAFVGGPGSEDSTELGLEDERAEKTIDADDDATVEAASALGVADAAKVLSRPPVVKCSFQNAI
jgi:hypothetical protein